MIQGGKHVVSFCPEGMENTTRATGAGSGAVPGLPLSEPWHPQFRWLYLWHRLLNLHLLFSSSLLQKLCYPPQCSHRSCTRQVSSRVGASGLPACRHSVTMLWAVMGAGLAGSGCWQCLHAVLALTHALCLAWPRAALPRSPTMHKAGAAFTILLSASACGFFRGSHIWVWGHFLIFYVRFYFEKKGNSPPVYGMQLSREAVNFSVF